MCRVVHVREGDKDWGQTRETRTDGGEILTDLFALGELAHGGHLHVFAHVPHEHGAVFDGLGDRVEEELAVARHPLEILVVVVLRLEPARAAQRQWNAWNARNVGMWGEVGVRT